MLASPRARLHRKECSGLLLHALESHNPEHQRETASGREALRGHPRPSGRSGSSRTGHRISAESATLNCESLSQGTKKQHRLL